MVRKIVIVLVVIIVLVWIEYIVLRDWNVHQYIRPECYSLDTHIIHDRDHNDKSISSCLYDRTIVFTGLARNVSSTIRSKLQNLTHIGNSFKDYRILIFENDSDDDTRAILASAHTSNSKILLVECQGIPDCKFNLPNLYTYGLMNHHRIDRMAFFRNIYMNIVHRQFASFDYLCVLDFDLDGVIPIQGLVHALQCPYDWSCICVNGRSSIPGTFGLMTTMYDAMAFCSTPDDLRQAKSVSRNMTHLLHKYLRLMWLSHAPSSSPFVPVLSAFNGLSIYKMKDVHFLTYLSGYSCEHISLHEQLLQQKKNIYIDLEFVLYTSHQGPKNLQSFFQSTT